MGSQCHWSQGSEEVTNQDCKSLDLGLEGGTELKTSSAYADL